LAQFHVFRNPAGDPTIPFVVQIQSSCLEKAHDRVGLALVGCGPRGPAEHPETPHMLIEGVPVYLNPLNTATLPADRLGKPICMLPEPEQDKINAAIDEMLGRARRS
jgi:hypothetical protein